MDNEQSEINKYLRKKKSGFKYTYRDYRDIAETETLFQSLGDM